MELDSCDFWHEKVAQDCVKSMAGPQELERLASAVGHRDLVLVREQSAQRPRGHHLVVDDQQPATARLRTRGSRIWNAMRLAVGRCTLRAYRRIGRGLVHIRAIRVDGRLAITDAIGW